MPVFPFHRLRVTIEMTAEDEPGVVDFGCNVQAYDAYGKKVGVDEDGFYTDVTQEHLAFALCQVLAEVYETDVETIYGWIGHGLTVEATETAEA